MSDKSAKPQPNMTPEEEADWVKRALSGSLRDELWSEVKRK